jgi:hypothetical protein
MYIALFIENCNSFLLLSFFASITIRYGQQQKERINRGNNKKSVEQSRGNVVFAATSYIKTIKDLFPFT